jgi:peptide/nickel transport system substrate-binding protein/oligopeptide transport system substrate-binding protein
MDGKWEDGQHIYLKRYDDYANGDKAKLQNLHFNIQKDVETAYREFQAGTIDIAEVPTAQISDAISQYGKSDDGYTITPSHQCLMGDEPSTYFLTCNVTDPVMGDVHLRHAISLAINRQAICDTLFEGTRNPADGVVAPSCQGYQPGQWADARYDVDAAKAILDQYYPADENGDRGLDLKLSYNMDGSHKQIMESVIADLEAVGLKVDSDTKEFASILQDYDNGTFQFGRLGWMASYPTMDAMMFPLFYTGNGDNTSHYSNPDVDAALLAARATTDESARIDKYREVDALLAEDMPIIPLMFYKHNKVGSSRIKTAYISPMEMTQANHWEVSD